MAEKQNVEDPQPMETAGEHLPNGKDESAPARQEVTVSFLLTKEDYADYCVAAVNRRIMLREKMTIRLLGVLAILCGFLFAWLWKGNGWVFGWTACLELIGLVMPPHLCAGLCLWVYGPPSGRAHFPHVYIHPLWFFVYKQRLFYGAPL